MCWTQGVSLAFGVAGVVTAIYKTRGSTDVRIKELTIPLVFFSVMEILQFFSYFYINQCGVSGNQILTILSYLHICLQPFFFNMMYMYFIPAKVKNKIMPHVYSLCAVLTFFLILRIMPIEALATCKEGSSLCGENVCSISGNWHIAWQLPLKNIPYLEGFPSYFVAVFVAPLIGDWKALLVGSILGPGIAYLSTDNPNEWPAIWCLFSVGLFIIVMFSNLRNKLKVRSWFLWDTFLDKTKTKK